MHLTAAFSHARVRVSSSFIGAKTHEKDAIVSFTPQFLCLPYNLTGTGAGAPPLSQRTSTADRGGKAVGHYSRACRRCAHWGTDREGESDCRRRGPKHNY